MAELIIRSGKQSGKKILLPDGDEVFIGRDETCRIRLGSSDVSRQHCVLKSMPEGITVRDLESRNGTFVNDVQITAETLMHPGDFLRVGPIQFQSAEKREPGTRRPTISRPDLSPASDADIASWLSDAEIPVYRAGDTTIISTASDEPTSTGDDPATPLPRAKRQFHSIAEEAADIIRRHWEAVRQADDDEKQAGLQNAKG